jgi:hypothetical protein
MSTSIARERERRSPAWEGRKEVEMNILNKREEGSLSEMIEHKIREKAKIVMDEETKDKEFFTALTDICTLNKLRDANK